MYPSIKSNPPNENNPIIKTRTRGHRSKLEIYYDILSAIQSIETNNAGTHWKTRVQASVFLSWNSFKEHISNMEEQGLIKKNEFGLTDEGKLFIQEYRKVLRPILDKYELLPKRD